MGRVPPTSVIIWGSSGSPKRVKASRMVRRGGGRPIQPRAKPIPEVHSPPTSLDHPASQSPGPPKTWGPNSQTFPPPESKERALPGLPGRPGGGFFRDPEQLDTRPLPPPQSSPTAPAHPPPPKCGRPEQQKEKTAPGPLRLGKGRGVAARVGVARRTHLRLRFRSKAAVGVAIRRHQR